MKSQNLCVTMVVGMTALMVCATNPASAEVTFEWVTVGYPGNAADPNPNNIDIVEFGAVAYVYRIAKHEVTNDQYAEFLNAVAATDTNSLFNDIWSPHPRHGITRTGPSGSFTYAVKANMGNKPVNYVSFFDAMRFVNWLHNGQPTGVQVASTTEDGVYAISNGLSETRADGAQYFIPTDHEWYKAAYHQPRFSGGDIDDYWLYPTASNIDPTIAGAVDTIGPTRGDISNPGVNVANYDSGADWNGQNGNVTTVGSAGPLSESFYGTSDQGGNVEEWNEAVFVQDVTTRRVVPGGSATDFEFGMWSIVPGSLRPIREHGGLGFRVASPVASPDPLGEAPAVSEWGLAVLVLLILTVQKIGYRNRVPRTT